MPHMPASAALARFRVIDLTQVRAGPTACRQLADWGADVIFNWQSMGCHVFDPFLGFFIVSHTTVCLSRRKRLFILTLYFIFFKCSVRSRNPG